MFMKYEEMKSNREVIKEFCSKYRPELTIAGAILAERSLLANRKDYIMILNDLSDDEFAGNHLTALCDPLAIAKYRKILEGEMLFEDFVAKYGGESVRKSFEEAMSNV